MPELVVVGDADALRRRCEMMNGWRIEQSQLSDMPKQPIDLSEWRNEGYKAKAVQTSGIGEKRACMITRDW